MIPTWLILTSTHPFTPPLALPAPNGFRAAVETAVLHGQDLSFRLIDGDLTGAFLEGINAVSATFTGSLEHAKLSRGNFTRAVFTRSLMNAVAEGADFTQATLNGLDLTRLKADRADFRSANLRGANCSRMSARDALFNGARFERSRTDGMDVAGATIFNADISHDQMRVMATPFDDIEYHALHGRTRAEAQAAESEAAALGAIRHFT